MAIMKHECSQKKILILLISMLFAENSFCQGLLMMGFYNRTCPNAETIVLSAVQQAAASDPTILAALLRLHFHDCFVQGCDGSILINGGSNVERLAFAHQGLRGFEVIDKAKSDIEKVCRGLVSCSDIVALAARDAVSLSSGPPYLVPTGRRDGRVSDLSLAANMPEVTDSIEVLRSKFRSKGLSDSDLVLLSGAHTIGTTACFFMTHRLYNFTIRGEPDPAISPNFLPNLHAKCPRGGNVNARLPMDPVTSQVFDDQILRNIRDGMAVIESDARLLDNLSTRQVLDSYVQFPRRGRFGADFARSIVKMGRIGVHTGSNGEIRKVCGSFN